MESRRKPTEKGGQSAFAQEGMDPDGIGLRLGGNRVWVLGGAEGTEGVRGDEIREQTWGKTSL